MRVDPSEPMADASEPVPETEVGSAAEEPETKSWLAYANPGARFLVGAACLVLVVAGLKAAAEILRPFVLAGVLAVTSMPLLRGLCRRGIPKPLAVLLTVLAVLLVVVGLVALVGGSLNQFTEQFPKYQIQLSEMIETGQSQLASYGMERVALADLIDPGAFVDLIRGALAGIAGLVSKGFLVLLALIFILLEATGFADKLQLAFGLTFDTQRLEQSLQEIQSYLAIKTAISFATGVLVWGWVSLVGVDFPVLWGLVAFLLNYIPNLGSIIAAIPPVFLALIQLGPGAAFLTALGYVVVNFLFGNLLEPTLMGRRLGLSTLVIFVSLVFWGWVWGPLGMLLSVPLTMVLKILLENTEDFRWLAVLLSPNPSPRTTQS
ncbi:MAG: AI-2E family transporter [Acidobacteria bacterium]|nr:AI-2E family transporter [Acidobacteriota bacterium]